MGLRKKNQVIVLEGATKQAEQMRQALVRFDSLNVTSPLIKHDGPGGTTLAYDQSCSATWAKVAGNGSPYSWTEQKRLPDGTWQSCCRTGSSNAYEVNGVGGLAGTYQQLVPDCNGTGAMHFQNIQKGTTNHGNCGTTVNVTLADIDGRTDNTAQFCPMPGTLEYTVTGPNYNYSSSVTVSGPPPYVLSLGFGNLPQGTYSLHVYSVPDTCGTRFDGTFSFSSSCPQTSTTSNFTLKAQYDIQEFYSVPWYIEGCTKDTINIDFTATSSGTICSSQTYGALGATQGGMSVVVKVTQYPVTCTVSANAPECFGESQTFTVSGCGYNILTDDWGGKAPRICYKKWLIAAWCCGSCVGGHYFPLPNATITISGGITGVGTTTSAGYPVDYIELSSWVPPKAGVSDAELVISWTVTHPRTIGASYNSADLAKRDPNDIQLYGGVSGYAGGILCPIGGFAGGPSDSYACGGCPEPIAKTLYLTTLGTEVVLTWDRVWGWHGTGIWDTLCTPCTPGEPCLYPASVGSVPFTVLWGGIRCPDITGTSSTPGYYFNDAICFGCVSTCGTGEYPAGGGYWATGCGYFSSYSNGEVAQCSPLLCSGSCTQQFGISQLDPKTGVCSFPTYSATLSWVITE